MLFDFSLNIPFNSVHIIESITKFMKSMVFIENLGHTRKFVLNYAIIKGLFGQKMRIFDNIFKTGLPDPLFFPNFPIF